MDFKKAVLKKGTPAVLFCILVMAIFGRTVSPHPAPPQAPTFYKNVLPILEQHCQRCHRPGEIAPMSFVTYMQTKRWARAIRQAVSSRKMPPWFADATIGHFSNDPSLTPEQIDTIAAWADAGAPAGNPHDAPPPPHWAVGWNIAKPDVVLKMPQPVAIPAHGIVEYSYEIVPTGFKADKWVRMSEIRPSSRAHVHHAVVYIRPPNSNWLKHAPMGVPFTASTLPDAEDVRDAHGTTSDMLLVYAPGSSPDHWPAGMAKFVPAGSDLVFQMHYTTNGHAAHDQTAVGIVFAKTPPQQRVITLQLTNSTFVIPPGVDDYRVEVHGTLPNDATLLSFFPHMHLRGKRFEYNIIHPDGSLIKTLLRVNYDFYWQLSYRLAKPLFLKAGTELQAVAWYDNSRNNPHNPDPDTAVTWGDQTYDEMMVGFFDIAVPASVDKWHFFIRHPSTPGGGASPPHFPQPQDFFFLGSGSLSRVARGLWPPPWRTQASASALAGCACHNQIDPLRLSSTRLLLGASMIECLRCWVPADLNEEGTIGNHVNCHACAGHR